MYIAQLGAVENKYSTKSLDSSTEGGSAGSHRKLNQPDEKRVIRKKKPAGKSAFFSYGVIKGKRNQLLIFQTYGTMAFHFVIE